MMGKTFLAVATVLVFLLPAQGQRFSDLYVFGDSMSDIGNLATATGGLVPAEPFVEGRFSNGPLFVEVLAEQLALGPLLPSILGGTNFAWGGAKAGEDRSLLNGLLVLPSIATQVERFIVGLGGERADGEALYVVFSGSSDIDLALDAGLDSSSGASITEAAADATLATIERLAGAGAAHFLVLNLPDMNLTPQHAGRPGASEMALQFNQRLATGLAGVGLDIVLFDTFAFLNDLPEGFAVVDAPCVDAAGEVCANPEEYLFFDHFHPTATGHRVLAEAPQERLSNPSAVAGRSWGALKRDLARSN
jgi:phospholipase/lecithinase/hemolysin